MKFRWNSGRACLKHRKPTKENIIQPPRSSCVGSLGKGVVQLGGGAWWCSDGDRNINSNSNSHSNCNSNSNSNSNSDSSYSDSNSNSNSNSNGNHNGNGDGNGVARRASRALCFSLGADLLLSVLSLSLFIYVCNIYIYTCMTGWPAGPHAGGAQAN